MPNVFSAGKRMVKCTKGSAAKCLELFKLTEKADGHSSARPSGLSEKTDLCVNNFQRTSSMPVIVAWSSIFSESQRRMRLIRTFLNNNYKESLLWKF